jgi:hypothetical protein
VNDGQVRGGLRIEFSRIKLPRKRSTSGAQRALRCRQRGLENTQQYNFARPV